MKPIESGKSKIYWFSTQIRMRESNILTHLCIEAIPQLVTDEDVSDNTYCWASSEQFKIYKPYPNPARDKLVIEFISPEITDISISLFNAQGDFLKDLFKGKSLKGYNHIEADLSNYSSGVYVYRLSYGDQHKNIMFVIQ